jgi:nucleotidyltransferase substrate binding protein (TIGR01987 family)
MKNADIRWVQRFKNYEKALNQLRAAVELSQARDLSSLEQQGLIQAFEFTHELAWNTLKDFLESRGAIELFGSRDVTRAAFSAGLIENGEVWMTMIVSRNQTSHTYNEETVEGITTAVINDYHAAFEALREKMVNLANREAAI